MKFKNYLIAVAAFSVALGFVVQTTFSQVPGEKIWEATMPGPIYSSPAIAPDGTIYVGSSYMNSLGWLCALSPDGRTNWIAGAPQRITSCSPAIGADGTIYFGTSEGVFLAKRPDGTLKWSVSITSGAEVSSPAIGPDDIIYFVATSYFRDLLFALRPDGTTNWVLSLPDSTSGASWQLSSPVIGPDGTIFVAFVRKQPIYPNLYAIRPDGSTNWVASLRSETYCTPAIGPEGTIYIGANDGTLYAFDYGGWKKWEFSADGFIESAPVVCDAGKTIVFGSQAGTYALDSSGARKWVASTGPVSGSPAVLSDGTILVASYLNKTLFALNPNGSTNWTFTGPDMIFAAPTVAADGTIYVASGTKLCALYGTNTLLSGSWSMFRHDPKHTGRSVQRALEPPCIAEDGSILLNARTDTGLTYRVECSTDLLDWVELTNFVSEGVRSQVIDSTATNLARRYYRLSCDP